MAVSASLIVRLAALSRSFLSETPFSRLSGGSTKSCSVTPTASTSTNRVLVCASGVTAWKSAGGMVRAPRPFICSKYCADRTSRMKNTHSSGLTSVPVAIMSTVTAIRSDADVRNACRCPFGSFAAYVIFTAKSLPLPNTSRTVVTTCSAWASSLQKISVFGTVVRPGKISVGSRSRNVSSTVRIWLVEVTARSSCVPVYARSSSSSSYRCLRVRRSTFGTTVPASICPPCSVTSVRIR